MFSKPSDHSLNRSEARRDVDGLALSEGYNRLLHVRPLTAGAAEHLHFALGENELLATQNVIDVDALHRQDVDVRDVASSPLEVRLDLSAADDQGVAEAKLAEALDESLRLRLGQRHVV